MPSVSVRGRLAVGVTLLAAGTAWAAVRISELSTDTQATNPIVRWEWLFVRQDTRRRAVDSHAPAPRSSR